MPSFSTVTVAEVAPKAKSPNLGVRTAAFNAVKAQVATLVGTDPSDPNRPSLVIGLDPTDKPLTIQAQLRRAAVQLGITMYMRRRGDQIVAYKTGDADPAEVEKANTPTKRGPKGKAKSAK